MLTMQPGIALRAVYSLATMYMLLILIRWTGSWLELDLHGRRLRWIPAITDPLIGWVRRMLPRMGPFDFAPVVTLLGVWILREILVSALAARGMM